MHKGADRPEGYFMPVSKCTEKKVILIHLKNIFESGELEANSILSILETTHTCS
jgi:hypothetical protein